MELPRALNLGTIVVLNVYTINDLPYGLYHMDKPVIYADDTRVLITAQNVKKKS
jgi:hypothetical protein